MSILGLGDNPAPARVRAGVIAACLAVIATFGISNELAGKPITTAEAVEAAAE